VSETVSIATAGNTDNPCLFVLKQKGYSVVVEVAPSGRALYIAKRDRCRFVGRNGPEVLGLVSMWEFFGDHWRDQLSEIPDILSDSTIHIPDDE